MAGATYQARRAKTAMVVVAALLAAVLALVATFRLARSRVETRERLVALTFDDGPTAEPIEEVLGVLRSRGVRSTFFVNGVSLARAPELGLRLVASGHELGNHTYSHERMVLKSPGFIRSEVERTDALIRSSGQGGEILFRPPFGWKLVGLPWYLARTDRTTVTWDVDADAPPEGGDADRIVAKCLARVRPGSILLLHPWFGSRAPSRKALPVLIDRLQADGYRLVTVRELLARAER
jgi:peptidoglycan/xylan/chitin deacetylase (PgdA/CDA1 family)